MARNRNREFSESDSLLPRDLGAYGDEGGQRLPAWAQERAEAEAQAEKEAAPGGSRGSSPSAPREHRAEAPLPEAEEAPSPLPDDAFLDAPLPEEPIEQAPWEAPEDLDEDREMDDFSGPDPFRERVVQARAQKDEEIEAPREAQRVEPGQGRRNRLPESRTQEEEPLPEPGNGKKGKKGKASGKKSGKKKRKSRKKKNMTQEEERQSFIRAMLIVLLCGGLFLLCAVMVVSNFVSLPILSVPQRVIVGVLSPIQKTFSSFTDGVADYLRTLKIRGNLEYEYEQLRAKLDDLATEVATMEELRRENESLQNLLYEHSQPSHAAMNPIAARVIGKVGNNYFSTLTLDVGTDSGVTDYMAVVGISAAGNAGLVGVTYNTQANQCDVRCIIDSDCTVAGLVQSSRDQGSVKGTLGTNGEPMCRMYYLPDNSLPRPGDVVVTSGVGLEFPKGIPIGYIRESTRGMEENKSYVVLEPVVDFQHLEYVTVYRYRPYYAEDAQARVTTSQNIVLEPLTTARPVPSFAMEGLSDFIYANTARPDEGTAAEATPAPSPSPTPRVTATPDPNATPVPQNLEYVASSGLGDTPSPSPRPTFTPTPSPVPTPDPGALTVEDDE